ncbi:MAG TPA: hypothetical protein VHU81_11795 [Thermoanaerobaculia bacterium]|jgi:hypothetical protein|nr:hypothetical protein [Thermoanaerobaculia bacterium]
MKKSQKKLALNVETLRSLENARVQGGATHYSGVASCLCETLDCPTHLYCPTVNQNTCNCA